jgi:predicted DNA-binding antitoxin AbrB/MazE fold protein
MPRPIAVRYESGVLRPLRSRAFKSGETLEVVVVSARDCTRNPVKIRHHGSRSRPASWKALERLVGMFRTELGDLSVNHDAYLYGAKKR